MVSGCDFATQNGLKKTGGLLNLTILEVGFCEDGKAPKTGVVFEIGHPGASGEGLPFPGIGSKTERGAGIPKGQDVKGFETPILIELKVEPSK